jgi:hypothetical protein
MDDVTQFGECNEALEAMVAIGLPANHPQAQIDLGRRLERESAIGIHLGAAFRCPWPRPRGLV